MNDQGIDVCWLCLKTDALKTGFINHDKRWHELYESYKGAKGDYQLSELPPLEFISLRKVM